MTLEDRIEEEMVVDSESLLDEHFEQAADIVKIFSDGSIQIQDDYLDLPVKGQMIAYLIGRAYSAQTDRADSPSLFYEFFYKKFDLDNSTIRKYAGDLGEEGLIENGEEQGEKLLVVENLDLALDRILSKVE